MEEIPSHDLLHLMISRSSNNPLITLSAFDLKPSRSDQINWLWSSTQSDKLAEDKLQYKYGITLIVVLLRKSVS